MTNDLRGAHQTRNNEPEQNRVGLGWGGASVQPKGTLPIPDLGAGCRQLVVRGLPDFPTKVPDLICAEFQDTHARQGPRDFGVYDVPHHHLQWPRQGA